MTHHSTIAEAITATCPRALAAAEADLLAELCAAHVTAARSNADNASNSIARAYGQLATPLNSALAAAMLSMGGLHAPATQAREWLFQRLGNDMQMAREIAAQDAVSDMIPGYGNSFFKDGIDPALTETNAMLRESWPEVFERINIGFEALQTRAPGLYPNLAAYTGAVAEIIDLPQGAEPLLVFMPRLPVWCNAWLNPPA